MSDDSGTTQRSDADELRDVWMNVYDGSGSDQAAWLAVAKHVAKLLRDAIKAQR